jgi:hypothetical protein
MQCGGKKQKGASKNFKFAQAQGVKKSLKAVYA